MATAKYNKLQLRKAGPFETARVQQHTMVMDKNGEPKTVSTYQMKQQLLGQQAAITDRNLDLLSSAIHCQ